MNKYKKIIAIFVTATFLLTQNFAVGIAYALPDLPDAPDNSQEEPAATPEPTKAPEPDTPEEPDNNPTPKPTATATPVSTVTPTPTPKPTSTATATPSPEPKTAENLQAPEAPEVDTSSGEENTGDVNQDGQVGGSSIDTGTAIGSGAIMNTGNTNVASKDVVAGDNSPDISIVSEGNGENSDNNGTVAIEDNNITLQDNNADIDNELEVKANSGNNTVSKNVGGTNEIDTGNATAVGTIVNSVNTNIAGAMVSEFNVADDQTGDLVLDYEANCVSGCGSNINLANKDNGSDSTNSTNLDLVNNDITFQNNDADVENNLILSANTGNNNADNNTNGNNIIDTGNATVNGNVINMLNNNIAGNVIYGVVNIFDDFIGNIIVPEKYASAYESNDISIANQGNGSGSNNNGEVQLANSEGFTQVNDADIFNNLILDANTGGNKTSDNTSGNNDIDTGNVNVDASILNIANNNIIGGDWWIVLVNEAGNWFGKIFTPEGALNGGNFAAKGGNYSQDDDNGAITLSNQGNGSDSQNTGTVDIENNKETVQTNKAKIVNNIDLSANTGNNSTSRNTGGSNNIDTGNANIQFNLVNFLNNNIAGGNVFLTVVNVFGSWTGDFMTPGSKDQNQSNNPVGGSSDIPNSENSSDTNSVANNSNDSNSSSSSSSSSSNNDNTNQSTAPQVLASTSKNDWYSKSTGTGGLLASGVTDENNPFEFVDEANASDGSETSSKRKINLAWLVLLLPAYLVIRVVRARLSA